MCKLLAASLDPATVSAALAGDPQFDVVTLLATQSLIASPLLDAVGTSAALPSNSSALPASVIGSLLYEAGPDRSKRRFDFRRTADRVDMDVSTATIYDHMFISRVEANNTLLEFAEVETETE